MPAAPVNHGRSYGSAFASGALPLALLMSACTSLVPHGTPGDGGSVDAGPSADGPAETDAGEGTDARRSDSGRHRDAAPADSGPPASMVEVTGARMVTAGNTVQLSATCTYAVLGQQPCPSPIWASTSTAIATVSSSGLVTAVNGGTSTISASQDGVSGSLILSVQNPAPTISTLSPLRIMVSSRPVGLRVLGSGFVPSSAIQIDSTAIPTTFASSSEVRGFVPGGVFTTGRHSLSVSNPMPGGGGSLIFPLELIGLNLLHPTPFGEPVDAIYGFSTSDVWGAGESGTLYHFDGAGWRAARKFSPSFACIWGPNSNDIWAAGSGNVPLYHFDGNDWHAGTASVTYNLKSILGFASNDIFGLGPAALLHYDGTSWRPTGAIPEPLDLGLWGSSATDLWISSTQGNNARMKHFDGMNLPSQGILGASPGDRANAVWGLSANEVYAVGTSGANYAYVPPNWTAQPAVTPNALRAVFGFSRNDIWAVGDGGTTIHRTATGWTNVPAVVPGQLRTVWGASSGDVWASGSSDPNTAAPGLIHWDGNMWSRTDRVVTRESIYGVSATGPNDVWALATNTMFQRSWVYHFDGSNWVQLPFPPGAWYFGIWAENPRSVWAVGEVWAAHWDGSSWGSSTMGPFGFLKAVHGVPGGPVYAAGQAGIFSRRGGSSWVDEHQTGATFNGVWVASPNDVWVVGTGGTIRRFFMPTPGHFVWGNVGSGTNNSLNAVWRASTGEVWAVGDGGTIVFSAGAGSLMPVPSGTIVDLKGIWGSSNSDIWAAGSAGTVLHYDGRNWSKVQEIPGPGYDLLSAGGADANNVFFAGARGVVYRNR